MKKSARIALMGCLIGATLLFIFGNSLLSQAQSSQVSGWVGDWLLPILKRLLSPFIGEERAAYLDIRKLAHAFEFCVLCSELYLGLLILGFRGFRAGFDALALTLFAAVGDETIQMFTGRGPAIKDVLIDLGGAAAGLLIMISVRAVVLAMRGSGGN